MGRKKSTETDNTEKLEKEIKELKSQVRSLQRQLKQKPHIVTDEEESKKDTLIKEEYNSKNKCIVCGKGELKISKLGPRTLATCSICDYRKVIKNGKEEKERSPEE